MAVRDVTAAAARSACVEPRYQEFKAEDNVDAAIRVLDALEHAFGLVGANPEIGFLHQLGASGK